MSGFYRVMYGDTNWNRIAEQLFRNNKKIPARMRAHIINDVFSLNRANKISSVKAFQILSYLENEIEFLPWYTFLSQVSYFINIFESTESYGYLQSHLINMLTPIYSRLTWESNPNDTWSDRKLRTNIIRFSCRIGVHDCVLKALSYYQEWMSDSRVNKYLIMMIFLSFDKI